MARLIYYCTNLKHGVYRWHDELLNRKQIINYKIKVFFEEQKIN
jgi:hypothetical protein